MSRDIQFYFKPTKSSKNKELTVQFRIDILSTMSKELFQFHLVNLLEL
jgi:hypothetical protein